MSDQNAKGTNSGRRQFLADTLRTACGVGVVALGLGLYSRNTSALPAEAVRPPGALPEDEFLGACIRCGLCARDCPYDTLKLATPGEPVALGTPYFTAREIPCEMCPDIPCVKACPTGALDHKLQKIEEARMGLAVLIDQESCIAFQGLRCEVCFNVCPVRNKAITLEFRHNERTMKHAIFIPIVHSDHCTGCGKCEKSCILDEAAIKVVPLHIAKGLLGRHYRLGWKEKQKKGSALVSPDLPHEYNLPDGMRYEHGGRGLINEGPPAGLPSDEAMPSEPVLEVIPGKGGGI